jgi:hypothetical protein
MLRKSPLRARPKYKSAAVKRHHDRVAALGCLVSGRPATLHHVTGYADRMGRFSRDDWLVVPLAPEYHQAAYDSASAPMSVERLGHQGFYQEWGIDLYAEAIRLRDESLALERDAA